MVCPLFTYSASEQPGEVRGQFPLVDEGKVVHGRQSLGVFIAQAGNAHDEIPAVDAEALAQAQVFVDVLTEFARLALDADRLIAVDQHEYIEFVALAVVQRDAQVACAGKTPLARLGVLQATHQRIPFEPFAAEEIADGWRRLQDQPDIVFRSVVETFSNEGEIVQLLAERRNGLRFGWRFLVELNRRAGVLLLLRPAQALDDFLQYRQIAADSDRNLVEKPRGIDAPQIGLHLDLLVGEPVDDRPVLQLGSKVIGIGEVDGIQRAGRVGGGRLARCVNCRRGFQTNKLALGIKILVEQPADEKQGAINRCRIVAARAGHRVTHLTIRLFLNVSAFVTAKNCHGGKSRLSG